METRENIAVGTHIWAADPELAFIDGIVVNIKGEAAEIQTSEKTVVANLSKIYPKDVETPAGGVDDMTKLSYLHEPAVLHNLATRYEINEIYTYSGNILIAVNPFQGLPHLYDTYMMKKYKGAPFGELSPHVFAVADVAYREMVNEGKSNSILVSGESGSGKTETTKMLMRYLAYLGGYAAAEGNSVEQQVLESNPVLEAFGNAKTVKNNNSSRFGKFVEIQFDKHGRISGAAIRTYLLERSRVCQISETERNYHCFYLLCAAPPEEIDKYKLGNPKSFHYLNQSNCYELVGVNDANEYLATRRAMDIVGISKTEQDAIFRVVAAILHLGNIYFAKGEEDSSVVKDDGSKFHLNMTAELLMCDPQALEDALCKRVMIAAEEIIKRSLDPHGATVSRDGLAKTLYSRLFDWLVDKINVSIGQDPHSKSLIGVLDIYGFESFKTNSFEQFCINFTNEKLQQHFNQHVFKMEQNEYREEEIDWSYIEFVDNQDILDLIEKKPGGIIALLDEACMFPKSTHETFSQKLYQTFKDHKRFIKPKLARSDFTIVHYAGEVQYQSDQFLDKNKDYVVAEHQHLLSASNCSFVAGLFPPLSEETTKSSKFSSIGSRFKLQLQQLMDTLNSTEPHYIRCVKPNTVLKPAIFENINVMQQLRSGGVLEAIRIKCAGFPAHRTFIEFLGRFGILAPEVMRGDYEEKVACKWILEKMDLRGYQIGKEKIFLRAGQMADLDARRARVIDGSAKVIQYKIKSRVTRKHYTHMRKASVCIQTWCRVKLAHKKYTNMKREAASIKIQKNLQRLVARKAYATIQNAAVILQTALRVVAALNEFKSRRRTRATVIIQACWRCHRACSYHKKLKEASVFTQSRRRGITTRREFRKLKMVSTENGYLQESENKSQKKPEEVTLCLESEKQSEVSIEIGVLQKAVDKPEKQSEELSVYLQSEEQLNVSTEKDILQEAEEKPQEQPEELTLCLQSEKQPKTEINEEGQEITELQHSFQAVQCKVDEKNALHVMESEAAQKANESLPAINISIPVQEAEKIETLTAEVETLKALLLTEKQRADYSERKCAEAWELSEKRLRKLEETERRVYQLQDSLNRLLIGFPCLDIYALLIKSPVCLRLLYCMSEQFSQLKMILRSSNSTSTTSVPIVREEQIDTSDNSDASSSDSDFTFPAPAPTTNSFSSFKPNSFQLIVQDLSGTEIGCEKWENDREGAFDDYF
ncbi:hypothetical protein EZV62_010780 [Acer yangbiense]|uniref:Myosin motor domain-containing protein n=1 Tax=Acer yangbiense TaxID=1000413 RepID=A0A5C7I5F6_9ROSI|nr:hypothetical protein EZV62_010780 [Acer yangbiense]